MKEVDELTDYMFTLLFDHVCIQYMDFRDEDRMYAMFVKKFPFASRLQYDERVILVMRLDKEALSLSERIKKEELSREEASDVLNQNHPLFSEEIVQKALDYHLDPNT